MEKVFSIEMILKHKKMVLIKLFMLLKYFYLEKINVIRWNY